MQMIYIDILISLKTTNRVRYINIAERCKTPLKYDPVLARAMWKIYHCRSEIEPGMARIYYSTVRSVTYSSCPALLRWNGAGGEISLLSYERGCNVADKPISESSHARIKRNVWAVRHLRDYRLLRVSFYVNSICWKHDNDICILAKMEESVYSRLSIETRAVTNIQYIINKKHDGSNVLIRVNNEQSGFFW